MGNAGFGPLVVGNFPFTREPAAGHGLMVPRAVVWKSSHQAVYLTLHRDIVAATEPCRVLAELDRTYTEFATHLRTTPTAPTIPAPGPPRQQLPTPELVEPYASWCSRVQDARTSISQGAIAKVVLARSVRHHHPCGFDVASTLHKLRANHPGATSFAMSMRTPQGLGVFLGATPEPLVEVDGHRVATRAIAGTLPRSSDTSSDESRLLGSAKDRHEHRFVVEMLTRRLADGCTSIHVTPTEILHLPQVLHLQARLVGTQETPGHLIDWVERLHPSPAVGGWPCQPAADWLRLHEPLERGPYAAPIGWVDGQGNGQFFVAIRSALVQGKTATAYAGAGIVADSNPDAEWHETRHKLQAIADALVPGGAL
ncbi:MAG: isochorismate synthase [Nannocystaceae bacterium]